MKQVLLLLTLLALLVSGCASSAQVTPPASIATGVDPEAWAAVPAGEFLQGPHSTPSSIDYAYEMMVTDVTNAQFTRYLNAALAAGEIQIDGSNIIGFYPGDPFNGVKHEMEIKAGDWLHMVLDDPGLRLNFEGKTFTPMPGYENHPMTNVTWFGAKAYCEYYGWRLPTEMEWEKAARGQYGNAFPWGNEIALNNANYYSSHDIFEKIIGKLGDTTPVGFYNGQTYAGYQTRDSASPYGLYDMAGNVWQWTADIYAGTHYRHMRGGSKAD